MRFDFATASRIVFGWGAAAGIAGEARAMGSRALLVTGGSPRAAALRDSLPGCAVLAVKGEPTVDLARAGVRLAREQGCDVVIGFGGGSAIDAGKAIAVLAANSGEPLDYLEVVGRGRTLEAPPLPFIAVPTTAGTGSEVTRNAVLASPAHRVKASLRSPHMLPRLAVVDPELTVDLPPAVTASTGLDALTQLIEPYVSVRANSMTDLFCLDGMSRAARSLVRAAENGRDRPAREDMAFASLLGGLSLANAGLGAVHGFAAPIGGSFPAPHGAVCAALLPHVMEANLQALAERMPGSEAVARYQTVARVLTGNAGAAAGDGVRWVAGVCARLGIRPLGAYGVSRADAAGLVEKASQASSMKGNPVSLTGEELMRVLLRAL